MPKATIIKRPVENIGDNIKRSAWSAVFESIVLIILGILFLILQDTVVQVLAYIIGVFLIVKGGFQIINYFVEKGQNDFYNNGLLSGVVSALIGIVVLVIGQDIANVFRVVLGVLIIYESLVRINTAIKLAHAKVSSWKYIVVIALIMMILGVFVTFNSGAVVTLIGWVMIVTGLIGIVSDVIFIQHINSIVEQLTK